MYAVREDSVNGLGQEAIANQANIAAVGASMKITASATTSHRQSAVPRARNVATGIAAHHQ